jgi:predicted DNA-binding protein (UPF0251 family)
MLKKILIAAGVVVILVGILGVAGVAYAQTQTPPRQGCSGACLDDNDMPRGFGMMGRSGSQGDRAGRGRMGVMMGQAGTQTGLLHDEMVEAMAGQLGLPAAELETRLDDGETMWEIAESLGIEQEAFWTMMQAARTQALQQAVTNGEITQEQADWMQQHMQGQMNGQRGGAGGCWNTQP